MASAEEIKTLVSAAAGSNEYKRAMEKFCDVHKGELKAAERELELNEQLAANPDPDKLRKIAAEKMIQYELENYREKMLETQDHLARTLSPERMQDRVNYMEGSKYFQAMCAGMSQEELKKLAPEGGEKLCKKFAETQAAMKEAARQKEEAAQANIGQDGPQEERVKGDPTEPIL